MQVHGAARARAFQQEVIGWLILGWRAACLAVGHDPPVQLEQRGGQIKDTAARSTPPSVRVRAAPTPVPAWINRVVKGGAGVGIAQDPAGDSHGICANRRTTLAGMRPTEGVGGAAAAGTLASARAVRDIVGPVVVSACAAPASG